MAASFDGRRLAAIAEMCPKLVPNTELEPPHSKFHPVPTDNVFLPRADTLPPRRIAPHRFAPGNPGPHFLPQAPLESGPSPPQPTPEMIPVPQESPAPAPREA